MEGGGQAASRNSCVVSVSPIPSSELPGHRSLHLRTIAALERCQESQDVDFKEAGTWQQLQWGFTHSALGIGNLRDGGIIVVGVSERDGAWELTGVQPAHLTTFEPDIVLAQVNAYVSPHIDLDVVTVEHEAKTFVSVWCREFADMPLVCKKNGPDGSRLTEGRVYVRPPGMARTTVVTNAAQMSNLLELAAEKRARSFLKTAKRVGLPLAAVDDPFERELGGL